MEDKVINILKDRTISISKIILKNYKKLNISDTELIIIMVLMSFGDKVMYNPEELASVINADKYEVERLYLMELVILDILIVF